MTLTLLFPPMATVAQAVESALDLLPDGYVTAGQWAILVMAFLNIVREIFQLYQVRG